MCVVQREMFWECSCNAPLEDVLNNTHLAAQYYVAILLHGHCGGTYITRHNSLHISLMPKVALVRLAIHIRTMTNALSYQKRRKQLESDLA